MTPGMPREGRILGIDYGDRRVGVAVSDPLRVTAQGVTTLTNDSDLLGELLAIAKRLDVRGIVVGMPYAPDGGLGAKGVEVQGFINRLKSALSLPVDTWDESFSSVNAQQLLREAGMRRKRRQEKGRVDEMAARLMLQEYLEDLGYRHARQ